MLIGSLILNVICYSIKLKEGNFIIVGVSTFIMLAEIVTMAYYLAKVITESNIHWTAVFYYLSIILIMLLVFTSMNYLKNNNFKCTKDKLVEDLIWLGVASILWIVSKTILRCRDKKK